MSQKPNGSQDWLENAYDLSTPQDNKAYYAGFAESYDAGFAADLGYQYPARVAEAYLRLAQASDVPVADIGCGTGLVAEALPRTLTIDGFDISTAMLAKARGKALYRDLFECDVTSDLGHFSRRYGAFLSAGTFTHGHLGPRPLEKLLELAVPHALFVIGINQAHFEGQGFGPFLGDLTNAGRIGQPAFQTVPIYDNDGHAHADDTAFVVSFRVLGR